MMSKSPINEAVLSQVLNHMRNGQLRRCTEMGLEPEILAQLQQPSVLSLLLNTPVSWCQVTIDTEMVKKLLTGAERSVEETRMIERALRLGATTTMLQQFFGLSPQDVALQRLMMGVRVRRGRWREFTEELDALLWHRWTHLMEEHQVEVEDSLAMLDIAMLVAEELNAPNDTDDETPSLAIVWNKIHTWIGEGFYPPTKDNSWKPRKLHLVYSQANRLQLALAPAEGRPDL